MGFDLIYTFRGLLSAIFKPPVHFFSRQERTCWQKTDKMGEYVTINDVGPDSNFEKVKAYLDAF